MYTVIDARGQFAERYTWAERMWYTSLYNFGGLICFVFVAALLIFSAQLGFLIEKQLVLLVALLIAIAVPALFMLAMFLFNRAHNIWTYNQLSDELAKISKQVDNFYDI